MSALRKMTSFLGYAEPTGDDDGYEDTYHHTADETYAEEFADGESEQLDDFLKKSGAQARYTRDGMTAYEIESQRIFFETAQAMDTP